MSDVQKCVDGFYEYFSSAYLQLRPEHLDVHSLALLWTIVSELDIIEASKKLNHKMTSGVDNIKSFLVKVCINVLRPLQNLFLISFLRLIHIL